MEIKPQIKFSLLEKLEFYDDPQVKRFSKVFPKVSEDDVKKFIHIAIKEMEGEIPKEADSWDWEGLPLEALAIRRLIEILHREAALSDEAEIMEYLQSINLSKACCKKIVSAVLSREIFSNIPKSIRLRPTLVSLQWKIDLSHCQRNPDNFATIQSKVENFHNRSRVILLLGYSNGRKEVLSLTPSMLWRLRHSVASSIQSHGEVERKSRQPVRLTQEEREALEERGETIHGAI